VAYLTSLQCPGGGFPSANASCTKDTDADVDSTAYAVMALQAAGGASSALANAVEWLVAQQNPAGYWTGQGVPNVNSTGLAAAALAGQHKDISAAQSWLRSQQVTPGKPGAGALAYSGKFTPTSSTAASPSLLGTAQGLLGLAANGSLATLDGAGISAGAALFAPIAGSAGSTVKIGATSTVTGTGFQAGEKVTAVLHSDPVTVGSGTAAADGTVTINYSVPSVDVGLHTVVLTGGSSGLSASNAVQVAAASASSIPTSPVASSSSTTVLANTGQNRSGLTVLMAAGAIAVLGGAALQWAGRGRRRAPAHARR
jgi:hypothetical protein